MITIWSTGTPERKASVYSHANIKSARMASTIRAEMFLLKPANYSKLAPVADTIGRISDEAGASRFQFLSINLATIVFGK